MICLLLNYMFTISHYSQWRALPYHAQRIFVFKKWRGWHGRHLVSTLRGHLPHSQRDNQSFAHRFQKSNNQLILWISKSKIWAGILKMHWLGMWPEKLIPWSILKTLIIKIFKKHLISVLILYSVCQLCNVSFGSLLANSHSFRIHAMFDFFPSRLLTVFSIVCLMFPILQNFSKSFLFI